MAVCAALLWPVASGCSLANTDFAECSSNAQCRQAFGFGSVCAGDGLCESAPLLNRCDTTFPSNLFAGAVDDTTVVFGNLMDRSLATHRARERSARLALKQANTAGGIDGQSFGAVFCTIEEDEEFDFATRQEAAIATARYLADVLEVPGIIGPASSDDVQAVFEDIGDRNVVLISPSATSPALTELEPFEASDEMPGRLWRTAPPDSLQGAAIAYDMREPGAGRPGPVASVAVVHSVGAYGEALSGVFIEEFTRLGGTATRESFANDNDKSEAIAAAAASDVEEVLFVSSQTSDSIDFMNAAAANPGFDDKGIFLSDAAANPDLLRLANPARFGAVRGTRQAPRDPTEDVVYGAFLSAYASEYGEDVNQFSFTANAFDAAWLLAYGAAWSILQEPAIGGDGIARGLRRLSSGDGLEVVPSSWPLIIDVFRDGGTVDVSGASGELDFDPVTEETTGRIQTWRIEDDTLVGIDIWPPEQ